MTELNLQSSVLVTRGEPGDAGAEQHIIVDNGTLDIVAGWRFLLDLRWRLLCSRLRLHVYALLERVLRIPASASMLRSSFRL